MNFRLQLDLFFLFPFVNVCNRRKSLSWIKQNIRINWISISSRFNSQKHKHIKIGSMQKLWNFVFVVVVVVVVVWEDWRRCDRQSKKERKRPSFLVSLVLPIACVNLYVCILYVNVSVGVRLCIEMDVFFPLLIFCSLAIAFSIPFFSSRPLCVYVILFVTLPRSLLFHLSFSNFIQVPFPSHSNGDDDHFVTRN